jgi:hypothetical protein
VAEIEKRSRQIQRQRQTRRRHTRLAAVTESFLAQDTSMSPLLEDESAYRVLRFSSTHTASLPSPSLYPSIIALSLPLTDARHLFPLHTHTPASTPQRTAPRRRSRPATPPTRLSAPSKPPHARACFVVSPSTLAQPAVGGGRQRVLRQLGLARCGGSGGA